MKSESIFRPSALAVVSLLACFALTARADLLTTSQGESIEGRFLGFADGSFRFQSGDRATLYPADEVKSVNLSTTRDRESAATQEMLRTITQTLNVIQQRLGSLELQLNELAVTQQAQVGQVQQRVFELNPLSRVVVTQQNGDFRRNGDFRVTGAVRNDSGVTVHSVRVRVDLLRANGSVIDSRTVPLSVTAVGAGQLARFQVDFPDPPDFESYRVTPDMNYAADPGLGTGTYPPLEFERRR